MKTLKIIGRIVILLLWILMLILIYTGNKQGAILCGVVLANLYLGIDSIK